MIIAGAGPAGCSCALYLAQRGIRVTLLEAEPTLPLDLRASTFHPPTLEMLDGLGVTKRLLEIGLVAPTYQYRDRESGQAAIFDLSLLKDETPYPFRLQVEQYKMTQVVCEMLEAYDCAQVLYSHRVIGFRQDEDGVRVLAFTPDGEALIEGSYLIGADGADSRVRQNLTVRYEGFTWPEKFLVFSTPFEFPEHIDNLSYVNYLSDPEEWCVLLRTPELWRVLIPGEGEQSDEELTSDEFVQRKLNNIVPRSEEYDVRHRTVYRVHQRVAETYRHGRVMLVGDSAHINNPLGGMGMNGGIHDAFNLVEKLEAIILHGASEDLLDRFDRQRRTLAVQFVQEQSIRNKEMMEATDRDTQLKRQAEFMRIAEDPVLAKQFLMRTSMIEVLREAAEVE